MTYRRRMGQNFLISTRVADAEAAHAAGKVVLEIGPGKGILTERLCKVAKEVIAVEKDKRLCSLLMGRIPSDNLKLINADFFDLSDAELELRKIDIVISNIPYSISSPIVSWLVEKRKEAVLCMQKEFVKRMVAEAGSEDYSRLSVVCSLSLKTIEIMNVPRRYFRPEPEVDSEVIYVRPIGSIKEEEIRTIGLLMQHKNRTLRKALVDISEELGLSREDAIEVARISGREAWRVFRLKPQELLEISRALTGRRVF